MAVEMTYFFVKSNTQGLHFSAPDTWVLVQAGMLSYEAQRSKRLVVCLE